MCVPPGCPSPLIAAFKCPVCTGPVVPISTYHPPIAPSGSAYLCEQFESSLLMTVTTTGRKCSCRSAVTRSMSASDASSSAPTAKEMTTLNLLMFVLTVWTHLGILCVIVLCVLSRCLVCRQRQAEEPFRTAEQWLTSSLQAAQSMAAVRLPHEGYHTNPYISSVFVCL